MTLDPGWLLACLPGLLPTACPLGEEPVDCWSQGQTVRKPVHGARVPPRRQPRGGTRSCAVGALVRGSCSYHAERRAAAGAFVARRRPSPAARPRARRTRPSHAIAYSPRF